jgi:hypothetical protein
VTIYMWEVCMTKVHVPACCEKCHGMWEISIKRRRKHKYPYSGNVRNLSNFGDVEQFCIDIINLKVSFYKLSMTQRIGKYLRNFI